MEAHPTRPIGYRRDERTMYDSTSIDLGQTVQDEISGFRGVVTTVGAHISGCTRIGVKRLGDTNNPPQSPGAEEFFFPEQLTMMEETTKWTDLEPMTSVDFELGERVRDRSTEFEGRVHVVNFKLFSCPSSHVYEIGGDIDSSHWVDEPFVNPMDDHIDTPDRDGKAQSKGPAGEDTATVSHSKYE